MALFQPIQQGPSGSAVTPKAEVQDATVSQALDVASGMAKTFAGVFQQQTETKNKAAMGVALTSFVEEQSRIAEAAEQGSLTPAEAHTRMRAAFNKHAANNPLMLTSFLDVQKSYADSQMGKAVDTGSLEYQKRQVLEQTLQKNAAADGFTSIPKWQLYKQQQVLWEAENEERKRQMFLLQAEAQRASADASRRSAALSEVKRVEAEEKQAYNEGLRTEMSAKVSDAEGAFRRISQEPRTLEGKINAVNSWVAQAIASDTGRYNKADTANLALSIDMYTLLGKNAIESLTKGTYNTALETQIKVMKNKGTMALLSENQNLATKVVVDAYGQGIVPLLPTNQLTDIAKAFKITLPSSEIGGAAPQFNVSGFSLLDKTFKEQAKNMGATGRPEEDKKNMENQVVNLLDSVSLYKDHSTKEELEGGFKAIISSYEMLKTSGSFDIPPKVQAKYQEYVGTIFQGVQADIKSMYLDAVDSIVTGPSGGGRIPKPSYEHRNAVDVIVPTVDGGVFKFVAKDKEAQAQTELLNRKLAPGINNLLKAVAVGNGNPDLNLAMKQLESRLFLDEVPRGE